MTSPYERALDLSGLDPRLERYFSGIPIDREGIGRGTFDVVGTPKRWLWPLLAILARDGIVVPAWEHDVPFEIRNRAQADGSLAAERRFDLTGGNFTMVDRMIARGGFLIDQLGTSRRLAAMFSSLVDDGALHLRSVEVRVRAGRHWLRVPTAISPRVDLVESYDHELDLQHVAVVLSLPLIGRVYEYSGRFSYAIEPRERQSR